MKTFDLKSLLLGVGLTMCIVVVMLLATSSAPVAWEYKVVEGLDYGIAYQNSINAAAKDGWEVVGIATSSHGPMAVMRRQNAVQRPAWWKLWKW